MDEKLHKQIGNLKDQRLWEHNKKRNRYTAACAPYTIHVDQFRGHSEYQVEHTEFGILTGGWRHTETRTGAMAEAITFTLAHLEGRFEPQHLEN